MLLSDGCESCSECHLLIACLLRLALLVLERAQGLRQVLREYLLLVFRPFPVQGQAWLQALQFSEVLSDQVLVLSLIHI